MLSRTFLTFVVLLGVIVSFAGGLTVTWTGGNKTTYWNTPGNWDSATVPTSEDDVTISFTNQTEIWITSGESAAARSLTLVSVQLLVFLPFTVGAVKSVNSDITVFTTTPSIFGDVIVDTFVTAAGGVAIVTTLQSAYLYVFEGSVLNIEKSATVTTTLSLVNGKLEGTSSAILRSNLLFVDSFDNPFSPKKNNNNQKNIPKSCHY